MIVVELMGGLGNQMFQYAFGLRLARERHTALVANGFLLNSKLLAGLRQYTYRRYVLSVFGVAEPDSSPADLIRAILPFQSNSILLREPKNGAAALFLPPPAVERVVCVGYWQSEPYFKSAESDVRQTFIFRQPVNDFTKSLAELIINTQHSVFVHIRRGDYVSNANASYHHGFCGEDYYRRAIAYIQDRVADAHFFVFSDDLPWVKRQLADVLSPATYVDSNLDSDSWQDMYLMQYCRHAVVANSSFSWWGAWLNAQTNRIVVAPQHWFAADKSVHPSVTPPHWIRL